MIEKKIVVFLDFKKENNNKVKCKFKKQKLDSIKELNQYTSKFLYYYYNFVVFLLMPLYSLLFSFWNFVTK